MIMTTLLDNELHVIKIQTNVEKTATLIHARVIIYAIVVTMVGEEIIAKLSVQGLT